MKRKLFCLSLLSIFIIGCENVETVNDKIENQENDIVENNNDENNVVNDSNENNSSTNIEDNPIDLNNSNDEQTDNSVAENNNENNKTEDPNGDTSNIEDEQPKEEKALPLITKIDLSNTKLIFEGDAYPEGEEPNEELQFSTKYSQLYKINNNNEIERVKIATENSDDDLAFTSDCYYYLSDIDENYFSMSVYPRQTIGKYLVNKKTGECRYIDIYDMGFNTYANKTSSTRRYVNKDSFGNYYGLDSAKPEFYSGNIINDQLVKTTVGENFELDTVRISKEEYPYNIEETFAVDKDGNVAYVATCHDKGNYPSYFHYITADGKDLTIETNEKTIGSAWSSGDSWSFNASTKGFWQGYDGEIYTNEDGYICKLVPNKDSSDEIVSVDQVRVSDKVDIPNNLFMNEIRYVFFDDFQEIYLLDDGYYKEGSKNNEPASLYCIYGPHVGKKVYTGLFYDSHGESRLFLSHPVASSDSIYIIRENNQGQGNIVTRINVKNNFSTSIVAMGYYVDYDSKMTKDNKMYTRSRNNKHIEVYDFETRQAARVFDDSCQLKYIDDFDDAIEI